MLATHAESWTTVRLTVGATAPSPLESPEVDWATEEIHIRLINWGKKVAIAYVDRATEKRIDSLRTKKKKNKKRVDDSVRDAMR